MLQAMAESGFITRGRRRARVARAAAGRRSARSKPRRRTSSTTSTPGDCRSATKAVGAVDVYTTLDLHLQRLAQDAVRDGLARVDEILARRKRQKRAGGADRRSIRAPARSSRWSAAARTTSRSTTARSSARRQPGSVFKPFVYLAAFEQAAGRRTHRHHAGHDRRSTSRRRSRSTTRCGRRATTRTSTTARSRCGARSRSRATSRRSRSPSRPATTRSPRCGSASASGTPPQAVSVDRARRVRGDAVRDRDRLHAVPQRRHAAAAPRDRPHRQRRRERRRSTCRRRATVARPDTTFLVTNMMRSVLNEGTGARRARAGLHARRRGQDRHDQRSARRLVRRLHARAADGRLGRPRRQPAARPQRRQAALPIWTQFMMRALAGHASDAFDAARRHRVRRHRPRHRQARDPGLPARVPRGVPRRHRADGDVRAALLLEMTELVRMTRGLDGTDGREGG